MAWKQLIFSDSTHDVDAWISGAAMKGEATGGAGDANQLPESAETAGGVNYDYIAFDKDAEEGAFFQWAIPTGWDEGVINARYYWTAAAGSGTVTFGIKALALGDSDPIDGTYGAEISTTDTLLAVEDAHVSPLSTDITIGGTPAEGDIVLFVVSRKIADTLTGDARLMGVKITYGRNSFGD